MVEQTAKAPRSRWAGPTWYVVIGVFNAALYVVLGHALARAGVDASVAGVIAYLPCVAVSYFGHKKATFRSAGLHRDEAPRFLALTASGLALGAVIPRAAVMVGLPIAVGLAAVTVIIPVLNYIVMRFLIFTRSAEAEADSMKSALNATHRKLVFERRVRVLADALALEMPENAAVLDVGAGDGSIALAIQARRPDVRIEGIDVFVRPNARIPVTVYDGSTMPFPDKSFDAVMFVDVLHHTNNPDRLIAEAARVARKRVVIKDHLSDGVLAWPTLRFMDWVGNRGHDVALPYNYLGKNRWDEIFESKGLETKNWRESLGIYPIPFSLVFDRKLHFVAGLAPGAAA